MTRVALITRSTLYTVPGGDTVQVEQTARHLTALGYDAHVLRTDEDIDHASFGLFHFFNITRPADILYHLKKITAPVVLTPILIDYREFDRQQRKGVSGSLLRLMPASMSEYLKTIGRWLTGKDKLRSRSYLWKGQHSSIRDVLSRTDMLLPNAAGELEAVRAQFGYKGKSSIIPNGIDPQLFKSPEDMSKDPDLVVCAARIEGIKNQLNLIKALNHSRYKLIIIGKPAPNQPGYYRACRNAAAPNVQFLDHVPQQDLRAWYGKATVHALPSWYETCGLSTLESAAMGCRPVITDKGFTRDYFGTDAFYCDPADPVSIRAAVDAAAQSGHCEGLQQRIRENYTWQQAAERTAAAYANILPQ